VEFIDEARHLAKRHCATTVEVVAPLSAGSDFLTGSWIGHPTTVMSHRTPAELRHRGGTAGTQVEARIGYRLGIPSSTAWKVLALALW